MAGHVPPIARVRLAKSLPRLLAWPALVITTGALATASWALGSFGSGLGGVLFAVIGGALVLIGLTAAALLLTIGLDIHEAAVRVSWFGGEQMYPLVRGPVTRVRLRGPEASELRPRLGFFGWAIGPARLRDEEDIHVVRLASTRTAILVPTERGRLAIAPADEDALLDALSRAARARQRLEELTDEPRNLEMRQGPEATPPLAAQAPSVDADRIDVEPPVMTGIERALLEQRLREERAAAEAAAADEAAPAGADGTAMRPDSAMLDAERGASAAPTRASRRPRLRVPVSRASAAFVLLPLAGAGLAWSVGLLTDSHPEPGSDVARLTALALVLAGPATSVGAIMALAWWPRLVGVVVAGGLAASAFVARALLG